MMAFEGPNDEAAVDNLIEMWKAAFLLAAPLLLTGCYNLVVVNAGVANKSAASLAAPLTPKVACAALASAKVSLTGTDRGMSADEVKTCENILEKEQVKHP
jgi:hypothetical protein